MERCSQQIAGFPGCYQLLGDVHVEKFYEAANTLLRPRALATFAASLNAEHPADEAT